MGCCDGQLCGQSETTFGKVTPAGGYGGVFRGQRRRRRGSAERREKSHCCQESKQDPILSLLHTLSFGSLFPRFSKFWDSGIYISNIYNVFNEAKASFQRKQNQAVPSMSLSYVHTPYHAMPYIIYPIDIIHIICPCTLYMGCRFVRDLLP